MDLFCDARETMRRYESHVREMRRLFVFHGLRCGEPESFGALGAKLAENRAFRTDVTALARGIREGERGAISAEEMLTVVALAIGGEDLVDGRTAGVGVRHGVGVLWVMLDAIGGWRETGAGESKRPEGTGPLEGNGTSAGLDMAAGELWARNADGSGRAHAAAEQRPVGAEGAAPLRMGPAVAAEPRDRVELAIQELKVYLDDIDRRMSRLEPHVEGLSQTVEASKERLERLRREAAAAPENGTLPVHAGDGTTGNGVSARALGAVAAMRAAGTEPVWTEREEAPAEVVGESERWRAPEVEELGRFSRGMAEAGRDEGRGELAEVRAEAAELAAEEVGAERTGEAAASAVPRAPAGRLAVFPEAAEWSGTSAEAGQREAVNWRRRIGVWSGVAAVLFATVGLGGLWYMSRPAAEPAAPVRSADGAVASSSGSPAAVEPSGGETGTPAGSDTPDGATSSQPSTGAGAQTDADAAGRRATVMTPPKEAATRRETAAAGTKAAAPKETAGVKAAALKESVGTKAVALKEAAGTAATHSVNRVAGKREEAPRVMPQVEEPRGSSVGHAGAPAALAGAVAATPAAQADGAATATATGEKPVVEVRSSGAKVLLSRRPVYPAEALRAHTEATVVLNAFLAKDGSVRRMDVVKGAYGFNRSAMDAVWGWRYQPLVVHGQPVETETQITVDYRLR